MLNIISDLAQVGEVRQIASCNILAINNLFGVFSQTRILPSLFSSKVFCRVKTNEVEENYF